MKKAGLFFAAGFVCVGLAHLSKPSPAGKDLSPDAIAALRGGSLTLPLLIERGTVVVGAKCETMTCVDGGDCTTGDPNQSCPGVQTAANGTPDPTECNTNAAWSCDHRTARKQVCVVISPCILSEDGQSCVAGVPVNSYGFHKDDCTSREL